MENEKARLHYFVSKINNWGRELGNNYLCNRDWVKLQKKYAYLGARLLGGEAVTFAAEAYSFVERKEQQKLRELARRGLLSAGIILLFVYLPHLAVFAKVKEILEVN